METADVRRRVLATIERAKKHAAERRVRVDDAARAYETFLDQVAIPTFRQLANVLKAQGYHFDVFTPGGSVRLALPRGSDDYIELALQTTGDRPVVVGHTRRSRGRRVVDEERTVGAPESLTEDDVLTFLLLELEPFVDR